MFGDVFLRPKGKRAWIACIDSAFCGARNISEDGIEGFGEFVVERGAIDVFCLGVCALYREGVLEFLKTHGVFFAGNEEAFVFHKRRKF